MTQPNGAWQEADDDRQERTGRRGRCTRGRPAQQRAQRGAGRPFRSGQDHAGGGAAGRDRHHPAVGPGGGRHHGQRLRRGGDQAAAVGQPHARAADPCRGQGQPARHARVCRLHRGPAGGPAGRGRGAVRRRGDRGRRRAHPDALGGMRRRRHATRRRHHQDRPSAGRLRPGPVRLSRGVRRQRRPAVSAGERRQGRGERADRAAVRAPVRLLGRHPHRSRPRSRGRRPGGGTARLADRGNHPGERGRVPHGRLPLRRGNRRRRA